MKRRFSRRQRNAAFRGQNGRKIGGGSSKADSLDGFGALPPKGLFLTHISGLRVQWQPLPANLVPEPGEASSVGSAMLIVTSPSRVHQAPEERRVFWSQRPLGAPVGNRIMPLLTELGWTLGGGPAISMALLSELGLHVVSDGASPVRTGSTSAPQLSDPEALRGLASK